MEALLLRKVKNLVSPLKKDDLDIKNEKHEGNLAEINEV